MRVLQSLKQEKNSMEIVHTLKGYKKKNLVEKTVTHVECLPDVFMYNVVKQSSGGEKFKVFKCEHCVKPVISENLLLCCCRSEF